MRLGPVASALLLSLSLGNLLPAAEESAWVSRVGEEISRSEYEFSSAGAEGWTAPNRAQNLRIHLGDSGLALTPRTRTGEDAGGFVLRIGPAAMSGAEKETWAHPEVGHNTFRIRRGAIEESFLNSRSGLMHTIVIDSRPGRGSTLEEVRVSLSVSGTLRANLAEDSRSVQFVSADGATFVTYRLVTATDPLGRSAGVGLRATSGRIDFVLPDEDSLFPLTLEALLSAPAWTADSDQANAHMGMSIGAAGDVNGDGFTDVIVGAPAFDNGQTDEGRAFVFHGSPSGPSLSASWTTEPDQAGAQFGAAVSAAGDVNGDGFADVVIGAPTFDNGQGDEGGAYVYLGSGSGLALSPVWFGEGDQADARFGAAVSTAGDTNADGFDDVLVGAPLFDNGQNEEGRVFAFPGTGSGVGPTPLWTSESNQAGAQMGASVSGAGDIDADGFADLIVGAPLFDNGQMNEGRAFAHRGSDTGPVALPFWTAESDQSSGDFGRSVAGAGDVNGDGFADVVVGAPFFNNGQNQEGRAYLFSGSVSGLSAAPIWTAERDQAAASFGATVATGGDVNGDGYADVLVGAPLYKNGQRDEGSIFLYFGSPAGPAAQPSWTAESDDIDANFGTSAAGAGDVNGDGFGDILAGAPLFEAGQTNEGRAFLYFGGGGLPAAVPSWIGDSGQTDAALGYVAGSAGDVNGDGFDDVVVGAPFFDNGQNDEGTVFVFLGSANGLPATPSWRAESNQTNSQFGFSAASAGDVNGDGYADLIVGAYLFDNGQSNEGRAFLYPGSSSGLSLTAAWTAEGNQIGAQLGSSVAGAGDLNGDGFGEVVVGAFAYDNGQMDEGRALVYLGSAAGLATTASWTAEGNQAMAAFGAPVAAAGDVDGDGFGDLLVGAWQFDAGETDEGRAYLYLGSSTGPSLTPSWTAEGDQAGAIFGFPLTGAGDVNGDGFSDILVGATAYDVGNDVDVGEAFLYFGSETGPSLTPDWTADGGQEGASFGYARSGGGDVNGDGYSDVVVGAPYFDNPELDEGRVSIFLGGATGPSLLPDWTVEANQEASVFGYAVGSAGDVDGDGFTDVIIGARGYDNGTVNEGAAFVYSGNGGRGPDRIPRQVRVNDSAPIGIGGLTDPPTEFRLRVKGRTPAGRGHIRLQWDVKPQGVPFDGTGIVSGNLAQTGVPDAGGSSVSMTEVASGLTPGETYRWRIRFASPSPYFPRSPWLSPPENARTETDLRAPGCLDGDGDGYGTPGSVFCPAGPLTDCDDLHASAHPGGTEACDNLDNDCNGTVDGFATTCGVGACHSTGNCTAGSDSCSPGTPSTELCDNIDNNCDGTVDGFATSCGVGTCQRSGTCTAGSNSCTPGSPTPEQCDGLDNNCDGTVDNAPPPTGSPVLSASGDLLTWSSLPAATQYDVVRGSVANLHTSLGDFITATDSCLSSNIIVTNLAILADPPAGEGYWYLIRGESCGGAGTWNSVAPAQSGSRDAEIAASPAACP